MRLLEMALSAVLIVLICAAFVSGVDQASRENRSVSGLTVDIAARKTKTGANSVQRKLHEHSRQNAHRNLKGLGNDAAEFDAQRKVAKQRLARELKSFRDKTQKKEEESIEIEIIEEKEEDEERKLSSFSDGLDKLGEEEMDLLFGIGSVFGRVPSQAPSAAPSQTQAGGSYAPTNQAPTFMPTVDTTFLAHTNKSTNLPASVQLDDLSNNEYIGA